MDTGYEKLMQTVFTNYAEKDVQLLDRAFAFAQKAHANQKRTRSRPRSSSRA